MERIESERQFHESRYSHDAGNRREDKFYAAVSHWQGDYFKFLNELRPGRVLEIGCGNGDSTSIISRNPALDIDAIDISENAIRLAERRTQEAVKKINFSVGDAHQLRYPAATFDCVCGLGILHHLDMRTALPEFARVLKKNGIFIFGEPLGTNPLINLYRHLTPGSRTADETPFRKEHFELIGNCFREMHVRYYGLVSLAALPLLLALPAESNISKWVLKVDPKVANRRLLRKFAWTSLIVAVK